jgi:hypothetical protein
MLVDIQRAVILISKEMDTLAHTAMVQPFSDYSAYMKAVGKYEGLMAALAKLRESAVDKEDDA